MMTFQEKYFNFPSLAWFSMLSSHTCFRWDGWHYFMIYLNFSVFDFLKWFLLSEQFFKCNKKHIDCFVSDQWSAVGRRKFLSSIFPCKLSIFSLSNVLAKSNHKIISDPPIFSTTTKCSKTIHPYKEKKLINKYRVRHGMA